MVAIKIAGPANAQARERELDRETAVAARTPAARSIAGKRDRKFIFIDTSEAGIATSVTRIL